MSGVFERTPVHVEVYISSDCIIPNAEIKIWCLNYLSNIPVFTDGKIIFKLYFKIFIKLV